MSPEPTAPAAPATAPSAAEPAPATLRAAWAARLPPGDAAEETALDSLAAAQWRRARLDLLEARVLEALLAGGGEGLPSLDALCRYAARLAKELDAARERVRRLRQERHEAMLAAARRHARAHEAAASNAPAEAAPPPRPVAPAPSGRPPAGDRSVACEPRARDASARPTVPPSVLDRIDAALDTLARQLAAPTRGRLREDLLRSVSGTALDPPGRAA